MIGVFIGGFISKRPLPDLPEEFEGIVKVHTHEESGYVGLKVLNVARLSEMKEWLGGYPFLNGMMCQGFGDLAELVRADDTINRSE